MNLRDTHVGLHKMASEQCGPSTSKPICLHRKGTGITELEKLIFDCLDTLSSCGFCPIKIGELCNGKYSASFTDAKCDFHFIREDQGRGRFFGFPFSSVFRSGFELLYSFSSGDTVLTDLDEHKRTALIILKEFLEDRELAGKSLCKVLRRQGSGGGDTKKLKETEITVVLAEHLLGKLSPGQSYVIDSKTQNKSKCTCGCEKIIKYGETGIGHESVWHGFVDIMFSSYKGLPECVATIEKSESTSCVESTESLSLDKGFQSTDTDNSSLLLVEEEEEEPPKKIQRVDETHAETDGSPGGRCITEVKVSSAGSENQAISQAIVFSMLQRQRHPHFPNHLIPNIVISPDGFRVIMYESKLDVLICSSHFPLFYASSEVLNIASVIILWMVLHYRLFCTGLDESELVPNVKLCEIQSDFQKRVSDCLDIYLHKLKSFVSHFPSVPKETYLTNEDIIYRINVLKRKTFP